MNEHGANQRIDPPDAGPAAGVHPAAAEAAPVDRLRQGDEAAYEILVRTHAAHLLAVARRMVGSEQDAQDVVQQAFLSAFRALPAFNGQSRLSTWLHRIVVNAALMTLRALGRQPEDSIDALLPRFKADGHLAVPSTGWGAPADVRLLRGEARARVRAAVARLPEAHRAVLLLRDIEELSTDETARMLGVSADTVKVRLHRTRQAWCGWSTPCSARERAGGRRRPRTDSRPCADTRAPGSVDRRGSWRRESRCDC